MATNVSNRRPGLADRWSQSVRRRAIAAMIALVPFSVLFVGHGQHLVVATAVDIAHLDAPLTADIASSTVSAHIIETLFTMDPQGTIRPGLATSFEVSDDGMTWTFALREGVQFHDGTSFDAEAVKFNVERLLDPGNAFAYAFLLDRVESVEVLDTHQVRFHLSTPFAPLLTHLTLSSTGIQSPTAVQTLGDAYRTQPVGSGPFRMAEWVQGQHVDLARFDGYWGDAAEIASVRFLFVPEANTRIALLMTGEAHVALPIPPQDIARLEAAPNIDVNISPSARTVILYFNHTREPFTDRRVRQALNYAVDKEAIVDFILGGAARVSDAIISPGIVGYAPIGVYEFDPERARQLLAEAGYPDGFSSRLLCTMGRINMDTQICETVQNMLADVGVNVTIETLEHATWLSVTRNPPEESIVDIAMSGWNTVTRDADYALYAVWHSDQWVPGGANRSYYSNPEVDALLERSRVVTDLTERDAIIAEALRVMWEDAHALLLHSDSNVSAVRSNVSGVVIDATERVLLHRARID